jgi:hypothetical protein
MGSVRKVVPSIRTSMVAWPIQVTLASARIAAGSNGTRGAAPGRGNQEAHILRAKKGSATPNPPWKRTPSTALCGGVRGRSLMKRYYPTGRRGGSP